MKVFCVTCGKQFEADGRTVTCGEACKRQRVVGLRQDRRAKELAYMRAYRQSNPGKAKNSDKEAYRKAFAKDPEKFRARSRANYAAHREKRIAANRRYQQAHKEQRNEYMMKRRQDLKEINGYQEDEDNL